MSKALSRVYYDESNEGGRQTYRGLNCFQLYRQVHEWLADKNVILSTDSESGSHNISFKATEGDIYMSFQDEHGSMYDASFYCNHKPFFEYWASKFEGQCTETIPSIAEWIK
jgi:hypothetical protein